VRRRRGPIHRRWPRSSCGGPCDGEQPGRVGIHIDVAILAQQGILDTERWFSIACEQQPASRDVRARHGDFDHHLVRRNDGRVDMVGQPPDDHAWIPLGHRRILGHGLHALGRKAGCYKPDARIYQLACLRLDTLPRHTLFVAGEAYDGVAARKAGLDVAIFNRRPDRPTPVKIEVVESLAEIVTAVHRGGHVVDAPLPRGAE